MGAKLSHSRASHRPIIEGVVAVVAAPPLGRRRLSYTQAHIQSQVCLSSLEAVLLDEARSYVRNVEFAANRPQNGAVIASNYQL